MPCQDAAMLGYGGCLFAEDGEASGVEKEEEGAPRGRSDLRVINAALHSLLDSHVDTVMRKIILS